MNYGFPLGVGISLVIGYLAVKIIGGQDQNTLNILAALGGFGFSTAIFSFIKLVQQIKDYHKQSKETN